MGKSGVKTEGDGSRYKRENGGIPNYIFDPLKPNGQKTDAVSKSFADPNINPPLSGHPVASSAETNEIGMKKRRLERMK